MFHRPDWTELIIPAGPEHLCFHHGRLEWLEQLKTNVSDDTCRMPCRGLSWHIQKRSVDMAVCLCRTYSQGFEPITEGESWWNRNSPTTTAKIQFALGWRPLEAFAGFLSDFFVGCFFALSLSSQLCDTFARSAARAPNSWNRIDLLLGCLVTHGRFLALHRQVETQAGTQAGTSERQEMLHPILLLWLWYKKQRPKSN